MTNEERDGVKSLIERVVKLDVVIKAQTLKQVWAKALANGRHLGYFNSDVCEGIYYIIDNGDFFFIDLLSPNNVMVFGLIPKGTDQVIECSFNHYRVQYTLKEIANILTLIESLPVRSNNTDTVVPNPPIHRPLKDIVEIDVQTDHSGLNSDNTYRLRVMGERSTDIRVRCDINIDRLNDPTPIVFTKTHLPNHVWAMGLTSWPTGSDEFAELLARINDVVRDYHKEHLAKMNLNLVISVTADATLSTGTAVYVNNINDVIYITGKVSVDRLNQTTPIELKEENLPIALRTENGVSDNLLQSILVDLNKHINDLHVNHLLKIREHQPLEVRVRVQSAEEQGSDYLIRVQGGQQDLLVTCSLNVRRLNNPKPITLTRPLLPEALVSGGELNPEEVNEILSEINVKARAFHMAWMDETKVMEKSDRLTEPKTLIVECEISSTIPSGYILKAYKADKDTLLIACIVSEKRLNQMASLIIPQSEIVGAVKGLFVSTVEMADMATDTIKDQINEWIANPPLTAKEVAKKEIKSMIKQLKRYYKALG